MVTNIHITDEHVTGPVPQQACLFKNLKELDLDGGSLTGTIPQFLTTCFPDLNELDLSYNQVSRAQSTINSFAGLASLLHCARSLCSFLAFLSMRGLVLLKSSDRLTYI